MYGMYIYMYVYVCVYVCNVYAMRFVCLSESLGCTDEVCTVVSMLSVPSVFFRPKVGWDSGME